MVTNIYQKKYTFKLSDLTELLLSCLIFGTSIGAFYVLLHYSIFNKLLTDSTSSLVIRLFAMVGAFYLVFKAGEAFLKKLLEIS